MIETQVLQNLLEEVTQLREEISSLKVPFWGKRQNPQKTLLGGVRTLWLFLSPGGSHQQQQFPISVGMADTELCLCG